MFKLYATILTVLVGGIFLIYAASLSTPQAAENARRAAEAEDHAARRTALENVRQQQRAAASIDAVVSTCGRIAGMDQGGTMTMQQFETFALCTYPFRKANGLP